jgi:LacI family transcriptional regulator
VVVVDRVAPSHELCSVSVDDVLGGELGVAHLLAIGHERARVRHLTELAG